MTDSRFPDDLFEQLRQLTARVTLLEAQLNQRPGVTKASQGWLMADMAVPTVGAGYVQIGSSNGEFFAVGSDGVVKHAHGTGGPVGTPSVDLSNAPASYNATWEQATATSVSNIYQSYIVLLFELRQAGVIADV